MRLRKILNGLRGRNNDRQTAMLALQAYREVFDNPQGERVLEDLATRFDIYGADNPGDFKAGQRSVVMHIIRTLEDEGLIRQQMEQVDQ